MRPHYPLVTIVGGSGFVGRHTVKLLATAGYRIRILARNTTEAEFLKTAATVGQIAIEHADITRPESLAGKLAGSDAVINLVSILHESGRQKFEAINTKGAAVIATEARKAGATRFIQISALGAETAHDSTYAKTKLAGEQAVRAAFPNATILRPSVIIGPEDGFFQRFARMAMISPILPLIGGGHTKFQPVLVTDVAQAILQVLLRPETAGQTYAIAGKNRYSFRQLLELMTQTINRRPCLVNLPNGLARLNAFFFELLPFAPPITRDQIKLLAYDNVVPSGAQTLTDLGITPAAFEDSLPHLLARYIKS